MCAWLELAPDALRAASREECEIVGLADWLEMQALAGQDSQVAVSRLKTVLRAEPWRAPGMSVVPTDEELEGIVGSAVAELAQRQESYGGKGYPFGLSAGDRVLAYSQGGDVYLALLALSYLNPAPTKGSTDSGGAMFEVLAWRGLCRWLGKPDHPGAEVISFVHHMGQPSASGLPHAFHAKVDHLAMVMRDGKNCRRPPHGRKKVQGDGGVDLLAWRGFPDDQGGQFLLAAGCAAGMNFAEAGKHTEADPERWIGEHFPPGTLLSSGSWARCYFVPRMLPPTLNERMKRNAGVIVDRCRLAWLLDGVEDAHVERAKLWLGSSLGLRGGKSFHRAA